MTDRKPQPVVCFAGDGDWQVTIDGRLYLFPPSEWRRYREIAMGRFGPKGGVVIPMFANYVLGLSNKVKHDKLGANWTMDGFRCIERWWFG